MIRSILTALGMGVAVIAAAPATADTEVVIRRGSEAGPVVTGASGPVAPCRASASPRARLYFIVSDPDGIDYAAVHMGAAAVRPAVSDHDAAILWIAPGTRPNRAYRWRYEDEPPLRQRQIIPVGIEVVGDPIEGLVKVKDGRGKIVDTPFRLDAKEVLCR